MKLQSIPSHRNRQAGFSLVEIMVVVIVIGVLAATIIPQFVGTTHDAKVSAVKSHIANIESAVERFNIHMDRYPTSEEGLDVLVNAPADAGDIWRGPYLKELIQDPWKHDYQYRSPATRGNGGYDIWSLGADGQEGGEGKAADIGTWPAE